MKSRDKVLFALPLIIVVGVAVLAYALFWHVSEFEDSYLREQESMVKTETELVSRVITPMLANGFVQDAVDFCRNAKCTETRISLVRRDGLVLADSNSAGKEELLDNHSTRPELKQAFAGSPSLETRYSTTLNTWMIYYAVPINLSNGSVYALRLAKSSKDISAMVELGRMNTFWVVGFGAVLAFLLAGYIALKVRKPLEIIQKDATAIAAGELSRKIVVPESGILRELALAISRMAEQLKAKIAEITDERNEREFIFNSLSEGILQVKRGGKVLLYNPETAKIFGIPGVEKGSDGTVTLPEFNLARCGSPELLKMAFKIFNDGIAREREINFVRGKTPITLFVRGGIVTRGGEQFLLMTISDLTNLRRLESFRSDFIANVSHEIKTPLTSILSAVESLNDGAIKQAEVAEKFFNILKAQSTRLNALVQDILSLAALERRELADEKEFTPVQLDAAIENVFNLCGNDAEQNGTKLVITRNDPLKIWGDSQLIEQAVINLVGNGIKYSGSPRIEIELRQELRSAIIEVRDFGIGIAEEHLPRLFERFYRVHKERSQKLGGTGLGLAIVKHIAQLHNASASVESKIGTGTSFKISFKDEALIRD